MMAIYDEQYLDCIWDSKHAMKLEIDFSTAFL